MGALIGLHRAAIVAESDLVDAPDLPAELSAALRVDLVPQLSLKHLERLDDALPLRIRHAWERLSRELRRRRVIGGGRLGEVGREPATLDLGLLSFGGLDLGCHAAQIAAAPRCRKREAGRQ